MGRTVWRVVQWALGLAVLGFAARALVRNWDDFRSQPLTLAPRPLMLVACALIVWAMYALLIWAWRAMLAGWGQRLDGWTASRIWTVSGLGKYVPGKVWAIAGMALMAQRAGVAPWAATASAVVLQALAVGTGAAIVGLAGSVGLEAAHPGARVALVLLVVASAVGVGLVLWPPAVRRLLRLARVPAEAAVPPSPGAVAGGIAANAIAWVGYGAALWLLARGLLPDVKLDLPTAVTAFTASYLAGFLALLAPGGLGVREGLFILMLQQPIGIGPATILAVASRLLLTLTEFGAAAPFLLLTRRSPRVVL
ncbi:MAG TPA: lysylphosphatidylglycerol synthase domain-containing protein [Gemmatimonadales bacterium]